MMTREEFEIERLRLEMLVDAAARDLAAATAQVTLAKRAARAAEHALRQHIKAGKRLDVRPVGRPPVTQERLAALIGTKPVELKELRSALGLADRSGISYSLRALIADGKIVRVGHGLYRRAEGVR